MNVLGVNAHPDDIELMAGGTLARWIAEGHTVHVLTFTDGGWTAPDGTVMRAEEGLTEEREAASCIGYTVENLGYPALEMSFQDKHVVEVLDRVAEHKIDTMITHWDGDLHHDHEVVSRIAMAASRRVPRVLMGQVNYYLREVFTPNYFVDITDTWRQKIEALGCYKSQWERQRADWTEFLDQTTSYFGKMAGVRRAEGFVTRKYLY